MTTAKKPPPPVDGALKPARTKLRHTINALLEQWHQLLQATPSQDTTSRSVPKSKPPMWIDAISLIEEISQGIANIQPTPHTTVGRLKELRRNRWRPQDVDHIEQITKLLDNYTKRIDQLINPHRMHIAAPCPACNTLTVYRKDHTGEPVRQPALQIGPYGCECMNCHHTWGPGLYQHLANVLGCPKPEGVLE
jgi:hypothetical protein